MASADIVRFETIEVLYKTLRVDALIRIVTFSVPASLYCVEHDSSLVVAFVVLGRIHADYRYYAMCTFNGYGTYTTLSFISR